MMRMLTTLWNIAQPSERRYLQLGIIDQQLIDAGKLFRGDTREQILGPATS